MAQSEFHCFYGGTHPRLLDQKCTLFDVNYQPTHMSVTELENGFRELGQKIYDRDFIEERRRRFFQRQNELRQQRAVSDAG